MKCLCNDTIVSSVNNFTCNRVLQIIWIDQVILDGWTDSTTHSYIVVIISVITFVWYFMTHTHTHTLNNMFFIPIPELLCKRCMVKYQSKLVMAGFKGNLYFGVFSEFWWLSAYTQPREYILCFIFFLVLNYGDFDFFLLRIRYDIDALVLS